jgi:hypothetical protein
MNRAAVRKDLARKEVIYKCTGAGCISSITTWQKQRDCLHFSQMQGSSRCEFSSIDGICGRKKFAAWEKK